MVVVGTHFTFLLVVVWLKSKSTEMLIVFSFFAPQTQRQPRCLSQKLKVMGCGQLLGRVPETSRRKKHREAR